MKCGKKALFWAAVVMVICVAHSAAVFAEDPSFYIYPTPFTISAPPGGYYYATVTLENPTLTNGDEGYFKFSNFNIPSADSPFSILSTTCDPNKEYKYGEGCEVVIKFEPSSDANPGVVNEYLQFDVQEHLIDPNEPDKTYTYSHPMQGNVISDDMPILLPVGPEWETIDKGDLNIGEPVTYSYTVQNTGTAPAHLTFYDTITVGEPEWIASRELQCPEELQPGETCNFVVTLDPTWQELNYYAYVECPQCITDTYTTEVHITAHATYINYQVFAATNSSCEYNYDPMTCGQYDFGTVNAGDISDEVEFIIKVDSGTLRIDNLQIPDSNFELSDPNHCASATLAPGTTCSFYVSFAPDTPGLHEAPIQITSNAFVEVYDENGNVIDKIYTTEPLTLTGYGSGQDIEVDPDNVDFGNVVFGTDPPQQIITVMNAGSAILSITDVQIEDSINFSMDNQCQDANLQGGETCEILVSFTPQTAEQGLTETNIHISSNDPDENPLTVHLSGTPVTVTVEVDPASKDYGRIPVNSSSEAVFTVTNTGTGEATLSDIALDDGTVFWITEQNCQMDVPMSPGDQCSFTVRALPKQNGVHSANAIISLSAPDNSQITVPLTVEAISATLQPEPDTVDFGNVPLYQSADQTITIRNTGLADGLVGGISIDNPEFVVKDDTCSGKVLSTDETCTVTVRYSPSQTGPAVGQMIITVSDENIETHPASLQANGVDPDVVVTPRQLEFEPYINAPTYASLTVSNAGTESFDITDVEFVSDAYSVAENTCTSLASGEQCDITIKFEPLSGTGGDYSGYAILHTTDPDEQEVRINLTARKLYTTNLGIFYLPPIAGPLKNMSGQWPISTWNLVKTLTEPTDIMAYVTGDVPLTINGVRINPGERKVVAENVVRDNPVQMPLYVSEEHVAGNAEIWLYGTNPNVTHAGRLQVSVWELGNVQIANNEDELHIHKLAEKADIEISLTTAHTTFTADEERAQKNRIDRTIGLVRWKNIPEGLEPNPYTMHLTGYAKTEGSYSLTAEVVMFDANNVEHLLYSDTVTLIVEEPPPIEIAMNPLSSFEELLSDPTNLKTYVNQQQVGRYIITSPYPGVHIKIESPNQDTREYTSYRTSYSAVASTNIAQLWDTETITVTTYYERYPEYTFTQTYTFTAVPMTPQLVLTLPSDALHTEQDITISGRLGMQKKKNTYAYDANVMGQWNIRMYEETSEGVVPLGETVACNPIDGTFELNLGRMPAGTHKLHAVGQMLDANGSPTEQTIESRPIRIAVKNGSAIHAELVTYNTSGPVPFTPQISVKLENNKQNNDLDQVVWYVSTDGGTSYLPLEEESSRSIRPKLDTAGVRLYKAQLTNKWSGITTETEALEIQAFNVPDIVISGPNATIAGHPITINVTTQNGIPSEYTWEVVMPKAETPEIYNGDTITLLPEDPGSIYIKVQAKQIGAPEGNTRTTATAYARIRVSEPELRGASIKGKKYIETGKSYTYTAQILPLFPSSYSSEITLAGKWILPDGTEVTDNQLEYSTQEEGRQCLQYKVWVEQMPNITRTTQYCVVAWSYKWPEWKISTRVVDNRVPALVRYLVMPTTTDGWRNIRTEPISYSWNWPEATKVVRDNGYSAAVEYLEPGIYQPAVTITDTRGNTTVLQPDMVEIQPAPELKAELVASPNDRWDRAPSDVYVRVVLTSIPKNDYFKSAQYKLNGKPVKEGRYSTVIHIDEPGEHTISAVINTQNGEQAVATAPVTLTQGDNPKCDILSYGDGIERLELRARCTVEKGYVVEYHWTIDGEPFSYSSSRLSFAKSDLDEGVHTVELRAVTDKGQEGTATWTNPNL